MDIQVVQIKKSIGKQVICINLFGKPLSMVSLNPTLTSFNDNPYLLLMVTIFNLIIQTYNWLNECCINKVLPEKIHYLDSIYNVRGKGERVFPLQWLKCDLLDIIPQRWAGAIFDESSARVTLSSEEIQRVINPLWNADTVGS